MYLGLHLLVPVNINQLFVVHGQGIHKHHMTILVRERAVLKQQRSIFHLANCLLIWLGNGNIDIIIIRRHSYVIAFNILLKDFS